MNKTPPKQLLMVILYGNYRIDSISEVAETITEFDCSIITSRMLNLKQYSTMNILISGSWSALLKLETSLNALAKNLHLSIVSHRLEMKEPVEQESIMNYTIEVIAEDRPGILNAISSFLTTQNIYVAEVYSNTSQNMYGTPVCGLVLKVHIPTNIQISEIREQLMLICDAINVDAIFEPERLG